MPETQNRTDSPFQRELGGGGFFHYFHWHYLLVPLASSIVAVFMGADKELIEFVIAPVALAVNLFLVWGKTIREGSDELTPFRSLLSYKLLPDSSGKPLPFNTEIAVVEDERSQDEFCKQLDRRYRRRLSPRDKSNLVFRPVACGSSSKEDFETRLTSELSNARAVVVVRTPDLEERTAAYDAVEAMAYKMSEAPILFTELPPEECGPSAVPKNFRSIPKDAYTLPWRLLQRANERGSTWRDQAGFNGLIVANLLAYALVVVFIAFYAYVHEKESNANVTSELIDAMETKEQYETLIGGQPVNVSYWFEYGSWFGYGGNPHIYVTTEKEKQPNEWPDDKSSVIGCAFAHPNHYAQWDANDPGNVHVWSYDHHEMENPGCGMSSRDNKPIPSIVCASYKLPAAGREDMVGVCVFAKNGEHVVINNEVSEFLRQKAEDFHKRTSERVSEHKKMVPLSEREP
jgi:hypothetical protein